MHLLYAPRKIFQKITQIYGLFLNPQPFLKNFLFWREKMSRCNKKVVISFL